MASAQSLGTLTLDLQAKTATLESDLGKAQRITEQRLQAMQTRAVAVGTLIGDAISSAIQKLPDILTHSLDQFDQFSKAAQKVGLGTEEFSKLNYAAKLADVSTEDLTSTLAKLAKNQVAAAEGNKEMADNFATLGIKVKNADGSLRSGSEVFGDLADLFQKLPDGAGKTAIAIALLGKSGANAIPLLNGGRDSLKELGDQAEAFGISVSEEAGKAAEQFNDNLTKLSSAAEGFGAQLTRDLLPALTGVTNELVTSAEKEGFFKDAADGVATVLLAIAKGAAFAVAGIRDLGTTFAAATDTASNYYNTQIKGQTALGTLAKAAVAASNPVGSIQAFQATGSNKGVGSNLVDGYLQANTKLEETLKVLNNTSLKTDNPASKASDADALARQNAFIGALAARTAATKAQSDADRLARQAQKEALDLDDRVAKDANSMTANLQKQADTLYKSTVPGLDAYNESLQRINEEGAKFLKDATNKITGVIRPEDETRIDKYVAQMQALAKATLDAAAAANALAERNKTLDLEAEASDAFAAQQGYAGLAVEANNYAKQIEELQLAYENNSASDATEQYQRQRAALDTLHQLRVQSIKSDYDDTSKFIKAGAQTLEDAIAGALNGEGFKNGIKGFLDGIADALRKASAQILAADIGKYLFGNAAQTGQLGGASSSGSSWLAALFGSSQSNSSSAAAVRQQEASITGDSSGTGTWDSIISGLAGLFKASGGPVYAGRGYIVGEEGPEWFQPPSNGMIIPNRALPNTQMTRAANRVTNIAVNVQPTTTRRTATQTATETERRLRTASARNS